jgi:hypothetical protein
MFVRPVITHCLSEPIDRGVIALLQETHENPCGEDNRSIGANRLKNVS